MLHPKNLLLAFGLFLLLAPALAGTGRPMTSTSVTPVDLHCEDLVDPLGIDRPEPRLRWRLEAPTGGQDGLRNWLQAAYQVVVETPDGRTGKPRKLWDSGRVATSASETLYAGPPLPSRQECRWRVRVWDGKGRVSPWSATARWSMGLLRPTDWTAQWISRRDSSPLHTDRRRLYLPPADRFRHQFQLTGPIRRATLYATALGIYACRLNGRPVEDRYFTPGWTDYGKRLYYQTYDVTSLVQNGENALAATLADGWWSGYVGYGLLVGYGPHRTGRSFYGKTPALRLQLEVEQANGKVVTVGTSPEWQVTNEGPVREADLLMGETYDAQREQSGWDRIGYRAAGWQSAVPAAANGPLTAPYADSAGERTIQLGFREPPRLEAYPGVPVRAIEEIRARRILEPTPGVFVFDLGQNIPGVARLKVTGPAGTRVQLRFGEMIFPNGRLMTENLRRARATDAYILRGDPNGETWTPQFTYHGFQFVEVTGYPGRPPLDAITGVVLHSDTPLTSKFHCSDPMINQLFQNVVWTQRGNFVEVPTDCPQRDERLGWMGDAQIYARAACYHADTSAFYGKWMRDVEDAQLPSGAYPDYAPYPMFHGGPTGYGTAWTDAGILVPYAAWKAYGNPRILSDHYPSFVKFIEWRRQRSPSLVGVASGNGWGDWLSLGENTPIEFVDHAYFARSAACMAEIAGALGKVDQAKVYSRLVQELSANFRQAYLTAEGRLKPDTQTSYVLALAFDLLPEADRPKLIARLVEKINQNGVRMATGFLGTRPLLPVLSRFGHHDLAARLMQSRRFPSWGYEVANGATTVWERWNSFTKEEGFHNPGMNSFSHYAFGAVSEWLMDNLAGIDTAQPGFRQLRLAPHPPTPGSNPEHAAIDQVAASYRSHWGTVTSSWRRDGKKFFWDVELPPNSVAEVRIPGSQVTEGGKPLGNRSEYRNVQAVGSETTLQLGSGRYRFEAVLP